MTSREEILDAIKTQVCPWCGKGPFAMLPVHTNKAHDIDKWQLRDLAGLKTGDSLCDPGVLQKMSEHAKESPTVGIATQASRQRRSPQQWTPAGRASLGENARIFARENPERARANSRKAREFITPEGRQRQLDALRRVASDPAINAARRISVRRLHTPEMQARRRAAIEARLQPCGTVAAYKRGCRCHGCRGAKRASRRMR